MIPRSHIARWRKQVKWPEEYQVEQDLILRRIVTDIFKDDFLGSKLAFRGGTALNFLFLPQPLRYSEDCDLVQITPEPIGDTINRIREHIDPWLGAPSYKRNDGRFTLYYKFIAENNITYKVKIEINTREHFSVLGFTKKRFSFQNDWHTANCLVTTYELEELLGTKLRALYQRKKGRDFFDLGICLEKFKLNTANIVKCFNQYVEYTDNAVSRAELEQNLFIKLTDQKYLNDIKALLPKEISYTQMISIHKRLFYNEILAKLDGEPWKGDFARCLT